MNVFCTIFLKIFFSHIYIYNSYVQMDMGTIFFLDSVCNSSNYAPGRSQTCHVKGSSLHLVNLHLQFNAKSLTKKNVL